MTFGEALKVLQKRSGTGKRNMKKVSVTEKVSSLTCKFLLYKLNKKSSSTLTDYHLVTVLKQHLKEAI